MKRIGLLCLAAACGSSSSKQPDAAIHLDAPADVALDAPVDGALDAPPDAPPDGPVGVGSHHHYVVNNMTWPETSNDARAYAFDVDGNGTLDNQLGEVIASLFGAGFDIQTPTDQALARGTSITLADLQTTDLTNATGAAFTLFVGTNANPTPCNGAGDIVCGHHLTGTASFDAAATPRDTPIVGNVVNGVYTAGPGHLTVPLYVVGPMPASITLLAAHAKLSPSATGIMQGTLGGAISQADIDSKIYPAMQQGFTTLIAKDCSMLANPPTCGCTPNSQGARLISLFDTTPDCAISLTEVKNNSLIMALFATDVTVDNQPALSVGFAFTAVDATYTP